MLPVALNVVKLSVSDKVTRALAAKICLPIAIVVLLSLYSLSCSQVVNREARPPCREGATKQAGASIDSVPSSTGCKEQELGEEASGQTRGHMSADIMSVQVGQGYWLTATDIRRLAINYASKQHPDFDFANSTCSIWIRMDEPGVLGNVDFGFGMGKPFLRVVFNREGRPTEIQKGVLVD